MTLVTQLKDALSQQAHYLSKCHHPSRFTSIKTFAELTPTNSDSLIRDQKAANFLRNGLRIV